MDLRGFLAVALDAGTTTVARTLTRRDAGSTIGARDPASVLTNLASGLVDPALGASGLSSGLKKGFANVLLPLFILLIHFSQASKVQRPPPLID